MLFSHSIGLSGAVLYVEAQIARQATNTTMLSHRHRSFASILFSWLQATATGRNAGSVRAVVGSGDSKNGSRHHCGRYMLYQVISYTGCCSLRVPGTCCTIGGQLNVVA